MPLWGSKQGNESKPKHLTDSDNKNVFAAPGGWSQTPAQSGNANTNANDEVLSAIRGLTTKLGPASITDVEFNTTGYDTDDTITITVRWNEKVTITGTPRIQLTGLHSLVRAANYSSGSGSHAIKFTYTIYQTDSAIAGGISFTQNQVDPNGGTIVGTAGTEDAYFTFDTGVVAASGVSGVSVNESSSSSAALKSSSSSSKVAKSSSSTRGTGSSSSSTVSSSSSTNADKSSSSSVVTYSSSSSSLGNSSSSDEGVIGLSSSVATRSSSSSLVGKSSSSSTQAGKSSSSSQATRSSSSSVKTWSSSSSQSTKVAKSSSSSSPGAGDA